MENTTYNIFDFLQTPICVFTHSGELVYRNSSHYALIYQDNAEELTLALVREYKVTKKTQYFEEINGVSFSIRLSTLISDDNQLLLAEFNTQQHSFDFLQSNLASFKEINGTITLYNAAFERLVGMSLAQNEKITLKSFFYPAEIEKINKHKAALAEGDDSKKRFILHLKSKTQANLTCGVLLNQNGSEYNYDFWDITDIIRKNESLLKEHNRLLKLIDSIPVLLFALDYNDNIIIWNKAADELSGVGKHKVLGNNWKSTFSDIIAENFLTRDFFAAIDKKEKLIDYEIDFNRNEKRVVLSFTTFKNDYPISEISYWGIATDITQMKRAQEEHEELIEELTSSRDTITQDAFRAISLNERLADSEEQLRQANATKDKFFSIIAHDLKSPIHSFTNLTEVIIKEFDKLEKEETMELLNAIFKSAKQITSLLENLLQWSRAQSNRINFQPEDIHINQLIEHNISLMSQGAANKQIVLEHKALGNQIAYADENMIYTVLRNLISNAIKFTHPGGKVLIVSKGTAENVEVSVIDNGVGMRDEDIRNLFRIDIYHSTTGTQQERGTGLGLILCYEFIHKNQGKISVESTIGKGSTFKIELPPGNSVKYSKEPATDYEKTSDNNAESLEAIEEMLESVVPVSNLDSSDINEELFSVLDTYYIPKAKELLGIMLIDDIALFAGNLKEIAMQYDNQQIITFAEQLEQNCDNFDLIDIENNLNAFIRLEK